MARRQTPPAGQILLFPSEEPNARQAREARANRPHLPSHEPEPEREQERLKVVLSGTFRKDLPGLQKSFEELKDSGLVVLSPRNVTAVKEEDGFVFMDGEDGISPYAIEDNHLAAIQGADFVWLHAPDGYVGTSASLEVGFARAAGKRIFSSCLPKDPILAGLIEVVDSVSDAVVQTLSSSGIPPLIGLNSLQKYYRQVAINRGYERESAQDCLLLMVEEVGELARALRKSIGLVRHGKAEDTSEALELADVTLYAVHMANILDIDLGEALRAKEAINSEKFRQSARG